MSLKIQINYSKLCDSPFDGTNDALFEFTTLDTEDLVQDILHGSPTSYLISGYRGAGKSSYIKKLESEIAKKKGNVPFIYLNFAKHEVRSILLRKLIRNFYLQLHANKIVFKSLEDDAKLNDILKNFKELYERTFYDVSKNSNEKTVSKFISTLSFKSNFKDILLLLASLFCSNSLLVAFSFTNWYSWILAAIPLLALFTYEYKNIYEESTSDEISKKMLYDDELAEHYLIEVLKNFKEKIKPVFILDELDKIHDDSLISTLINELKPIMLSGLASFIVVAGQNLSYNYYSSKTKDDAALSSLFSKLHHVSLFSSFELRQLFEKLIVKSDNELSENEINLRRSFIDCLIFESKRIPRRFVILIRQKIIWDEDKAFIEIDNILDDLLIYSNLIALVEKLNELEIMPKGFPAPICDYFNMQILLTLHKIKEGQEIFSLSDLKYKEENGNNIEQLAKVELQPFLNYLKEILLQYLIDTKLIEEVAVSTNITGYYKFVQRIGKIDTEDNPQKETNNINGYFYFKELVINIYFNLKLDDSNNSRNIPLSQLIRKLSDLGVNTVPLESNTHLLEILDNGDKILDDLEIRSNATKLFEEYRVNFDSYVLKLLKFYLKYKASKFFTEHYFNQNILTENLRNIGFDFAAINRREDYPDILFQTKYRKKRLTQNIKDNIYQAHEYLSKYNSNNNKTNCLVMVIFTDENLSGYEKARYIFRQNLGEIFPNYLDKILFIPVSTLNLHFIDDEFTKIILPERQYIDERSNSRIVTNYKKFTNQHTMDLNMLNNDDLLEDVYDLYKSKSIDITISPQKTKFWRFGFVFSPKIDLWPDLTQDRHADEYFGYIHICVGNRDKFGNWSDENLMWIQAYNVGEPKHLPVTEKYIGEDVKLILENDEGIGRIDINILENSVFKSYDLKAYEYCKIAAWSDGQEFDLITEIRVSESI